jgi:hypothetical protein
LQTHSFPTRRSSDLGTSARAGQTENAGPGGRDAQAAARDLRNVPARVALRRLEGLSLAPRGAAGQAGLFHNGAGVTLQREKIPAPSKEKSLLKPKRESTRSFRSRDAPPRNRQSCDADSKASAESFRARATLKPCAVNRNRLPSSCSASPRRQSARSASI